MTVAEFIKSLEGFDQNLDVYVSSDSNNSFKLVNSIWVAAGMAHLEGKEIEDCNAVVVSHRKLNDSHSV